jgi:polysaccharide pyruvyl transferase WcaK-like protein
MTPVAASREKIRCVIWGGYGHGNVGDELTLAVGCADMRRRYGNSFAILSPTPGYTMALFPDVTVIPYTPSLRKPGIGSIPVRVLNQLYRFRYVLPNRYDPRTQTGFSKSGPWADVLRQCELLYLVGGGYLNDLFDFDHSCLPMEVARHFGVRIETAPLGIGPFRDASNAARIQSVLTGATVRVRDVDSQALCEEWGVRTELVRDDGFRVADVVTIPPRLTPDRPLVGICCQRQHGGKIGTKEDAWWRELLGLLQAASVPVEGFCFHNVLSQDFSPMVQFFTQAGLPSTLVRFPDWDFREACRRVAGYSAIVTSRFHGAVVAGTLDIPTIAVANGQYYSSKMTAACHGVARSTVADLSAVQPVEVTRRLKQLLTQPTRD